MENIQGTLAPDQIVALSLFACMYQYNGPW